MCLGSGLRTAIQVDASGRPQRRQYLLLAIGAALFGCFAQGLPWVLAWVVAFYAGFKTFLPRPIRLT